MVNWHPLGTIWHPFEGAGKAFCLWGLFSETMVGAPILEFLKAREVDSEQPSPGTPRKPWFLRDPIRHWPHTIPEYLQKRFWTWFIFGNSYILAQNQVPGTWGSQTPTPKSMVYIYRNILAVFNDKIWLSCYGRYTIHLSHLGKEIPLRIRSSSSLSAVGADTAGAPASADSCQASSGIRKTNGFLGPPKWWEFGKR